MARPYSGFFPQEKATVEALGEDTGILVLL
jgi:hypothetical protein